MELGTLDIELEDVAPAAETGSRATQGLGPRPEAAATRTRHEPTVHNAPTRLDVGQLALRDALRAHDAPTVSRRLPVGTRFRHWVRRITIRSLALVVLLGGATYFARPYLPPWAAEQLDAWLHRAAASVGYAP